MLAQKLILGYSSRIASQIVGMLIGIIVARIAGPTVLGTVAFGMSFVSLFQFVADLGIGSAHIKLVSEGRDLGTCIATFSRIKVGLVLLYVVIVLATVLVEFFFFPAAFETTDHFYVVIICLAAVGITQLTMIPVGTFLGLTQQAKQDMPAFFQSLLVQVLRVAAVVLGLGAIGLSGANLVGALFLVVIYFWLYRKYPRGIFNVQLAREYVKIALPIVVIGFCSSQMDFIDKVMLQYFANSEQVGYYTAGFSLGGFLKTIGMTAGMLFFPVFSSAVARNDFASIDRVIAKFERFSLIFIMPLVVVTIIYSARIVQVLLGNRYAPCAPVLSVMVVGMFFFVLNVPYGNLIIGMNRLRLGAMLQIVSLVLFVGCNSIVLMTIPQGSSALGTAIVVAASTIGLGYSFRISIWKLTKEIRVWRHEKFLLVGVASCVLGIVGGNALGINSSLLASIVFPFLLIGLIFGFLFSVRWVTRDDLRLINQIADVRNMYRYIRGEMRNEGENGRVP
jgi:O-antigen/teichoic acid export membrane protein